MKKILSIAVGMAVIYGVIIGCADKANNPAGSPEMKLNFSQSECLSGSETATVNGQPRVAPGQLAISSGFSECLSGTEAESAGDALRPGGIVRFGVTGNTLFVYHDSAFYNCCALFAFTVEIDGPVVDFIEADTSAEHCHCMCRFNLESSIAGLAPGTYTVRLWTDDKTQMLGEAILTITGTAGVFFRTDCDTLFVQHDGRWANCGSSFVFEFRQDDHLLVFTEIDTSTQMMYCMCAFDLAADASGLEAGSYTVQLRDGGSILDNSPVDTLIAEAQIEIEPCWPTSRNVTRR